VCVVTPTLHRIGEQVSREKKPEAKARKEKSAGMPLAGRDPESRALAHYQWAGRYNRNDAEPARVTAHLDRAAHYMRVASSSARHAASASGFGVGADEKTVPGSVMIGTPEGRWFPARHYQIWAADELEDWELRRFKDTVIHYNESGVVMSCYRSPLTGGVYLYTYPVEKTSPESDATVRSLVNSSIQKNNSRDLRGIGQFVRVAEDWRRDKLQIHLDARWSDARPYQKFAYFDFMLRTKAAGSRVVYRTQEHKDKWVSFSVDADPEEVLIPALYYAYYDKDRDIALMMERDATDPAAIYLIRFKFDEELQGPIEDQVRYRMSDSALVKAQEEKVDKETRQRRPTASGGSAGGGGGGGASGGSGAKKQKPAKWADVKTVAEAYAMLEIPMATKATKEEADLVKKVSRKHSVTVHPDKNGGDDVEFKEFARVMRMIRTERFAGTGWIEESSYFKFGAANRNQRFGAPGAKKNGVQQDE
jgi:hypothetical protein